MVKISRSAKFDKVESVKWRSMKMTMSLSERLGWSPLVARKKTFQRPLTILSVAILFATTTIQSLFLFKIAPASIWKNSGSSHPLGVMFGGSAGPTNLTQRRWVDGDDNDSDAASDDEAAKPNSGSVSSYQNPSRRGRRNRLGGNRFPRYGTAEFASLCNWTAEPAPSVPIPPPGQECAFLVRPNPVSNEGLSWWTGAIVSGFILALQTGCSLWIDYGPGVDVSSVLSPQPAIDGFPLMNWTVPPEYGFGGGAAGDEPLKKCKQPRRCVVVSENYDEKNIQSATRYMSHLRLNETLLTSPTITTTILTKRVVPSPKYRFLYTKMMSNLGIVQDLKRSLPGFTLEFGMACVYERLFRLSPSADAHVDGLFDRILPAVRGGGDVHDGGILGDDGMDDALVLALYIRTGRTDRAADAEAGAAAAAAAAAAEGEKEEIKGKGMERRKKTTSYVGDVQALGGKSLPRRVIDNAIAVEGIELSANRYSRVVWMVVTDSPNVKRLIEKAYGGGRMAVPSVDCLGVGGSSNDHGGGNANVAPSDTEDAPSLPLPYSVPRTILTTSARGAQTKPNRGPSTSDFAEAYLDWHLLGESDLVISGGGVSFGSTGAMRSARPLLAKVRNCTVVAASLGGGKGEDSAEFGGGVIRYRRRRGKEESPE